MSDHNETNHSTPVDPNWSDDEFEKYLSRALAESGRRSPTLNENARAAVLHALLVENARLAKAKVQVPSRQTARINERESFWDWLNGLLSQRLAMSVGTALAAVMLVIGYGLFGGSRATAFGTIHGSAIVTEKRHGIFNTEWQFQRNISDQDEYAVHSLDEVRALSPVTITMEDGSIITAQPNTDFEVLMDPATGGRLVHRMGETAYQITPSATGKPKFWVVSPEGEFTVKGTVFRVRTETGSIVQFTDEGVVGASAGGITNDVKTGEQVRITGQKLGHVELQVPRISFQTMTADPSVPNRVFTNRDVVTMTAKVYPSSTLIALAANGTEIGRFLSDAKGNVNGSLNVLPGPAQDFQFYVVAPDGRFSRHTDVVSIELDKVRPKLSVFPATILSTNTEVEIKGRTEPGVQVLVDGKPIAVDPSGEFTTRIPYSTDVSKVQIVARDQAGNVSLIEQQIGSSK